MRKAFNPPEKHNSELDGRRHRDKPSKSNTRKWWNLGDDDDDPPPTPAGARLPRPPVPLIDGVGLAPAA